LTALQKHDPSKQGLKHIGSGDLTLTGAAFKSMIHQNKD